ncbi:hypothetical protein GCM10027036_38940 [Flavihumibacter cheonanensis]|uniref:glycosyltransferase family A protein n=1 Tax=Flavihumibacter cheonanensis TaxID=1442385 RepID=UPI001EF8B08E|nr:glycosyltransferase family A protein [Flavihumibacter cheonanensis]MCG7753897.1 glycosyltransferase family 2 protein [Flavihumibacter cheonanensis]
MEKTFCFIIPRTPRQYRTEFRDFLWRQTVQSLRNQLYGNWWAIIIGEREELGDNRFYFVEQDMVPKKKKLIYALEYLKGMERMPDYLIRLDDDDLFSAKALEQLKNQEADCLADFYHSFIEIITGKITQQQRNWLANTVAHKTEHAYQLVDSSDPESYLLVQDHSQAWQPYYEGLRVHYINKMEPFYVRILSPVSITSQAAGKTGKAANDYLQYLLGFGSWSTKPTEIKGFEKALEGLKDAGAYLPELGMPEFRFPVLSLLKNQLMEFLRKDY